MNHPRPTPDKSQTMISEHEAQERSGNRLQAVLVPLLILLALLTLFTLQSLDDNRFVSWLWILVGFSPMKFILVLSAGMFIAYALSRLAMPEKTSICKTLRNKNIELYAGALLLGMPYLF